MGKKSKSKKKSKDSELIHDEALLKEDRFDISKPQFRHTKPRESKVGLDERFSSVLSDPRFQLDIKDKYGRKNKKKKTVANEELGAFYTVQEEKQKEPTNDDDEEDSDASSDESSSTSSKELLGDKVKEEDPASRIAYLTALSRGELDVSSSSEEDGDDDDDDDEHCDNQHQSSDEDDADDDDPIHGSAGILDPSTQEEEQVELTFEESRYLAVMNMEWAHIRAVDVFAIVASFTPPGSVKRVQVFPSDFGMERMAKEDQFGPTDLWKEKKGSREDGDGDNYPRDDVQSDDDDSSDDSINRAMSKGNVRDKNGFTEKVKADFVESDFDPEKLRAYEASRLKYYFAIVEFSDPQHADKAYKEIDGMEFEHSSAAVDMRSIPAQQIQTVVKDRPLRDEATSIPSNYDVPEFIVSALQQTNVQCSWEAGDRERELSLTRYASGQTWRDMAETDDLRAYLASDVSSDEDDGQANGKGSNLRKLLGLDSDDEDEDEKKQHSSGLENGEGSDHENSNSESEDVDADQSKEMTFVPGKKSFEDKIRSKLEGRDNDRELTPWEKYQEKRKQKRRERRSAAREKKKELKDARQDVMTNKASLSARKKDSLFLNDESIKSKKLSQAELELLMAGDGGNDDEERDFDMRGLQRLEKIKDRKLSASRKRKEASRATNVSGADFQIDVADNRFKAVLDGQDDRFGIDRTDPCFKETAAMREVLAEQTRRRRKRRVKKSREEEPPSSMQKDVSADAATKSFKPTGGAAALSALVKSLKSNVQQ